MFVITIRKNDWIHMGECQDPASVQRENESRILL